jgi:hypothetical protein
LPPVLWGVADATHWLGFVDGESDDGGRCEVVELHQFGMRRAWIGFECREERVPILAEGNG